MVGVVGSSPIAPTNLVGHDGVTVVTVEVGHPGGNCFHRFCKLAFSPKSACRSQKGRGY